MTNQLLAELEMANKEIERLQLRINKVIELIENDYFEDGSFENYNEVMSLLRGEE